jgi:3-oxoacyl-[acyl-carrier protein] reductase
MFRELYELLTPKGWIVMSKLNGKVAIVTGASKGIGAGIAKALAAAGAKVVVNYASSKEGADRVVQQISAAGGKAVAVQGDMSKSADVKRLFAETKKSFGKLDVLVNNAGVYSFQPLHEISEEQFHRQFNTNVLGPILATQEAVKHFDDAGGSVINISSIVASRPLPSGSVYSATKAALDAVTASLAEELGAKKIRVNSISPGLTDTEGTQNIGFTEGDFAKQVASTTPLGRLGKPDDIAAAVVFIASDDSNWITGETIRVSGGKK